MNAFLASSYQFDPAALPYIAAGLLALGIGAGLLLYERFTQASRRLFALGVAVSAWLFAYACSHLAASSELVESWYRLGLALTALGVPLVYLLALQLTGRRRPRIAAAIWGLGAIMAALALGPLAPGMTRLLSGAVLEAWDPLTAAYVAYLGLVLVLVVLEFRHGYRAAATPTERRRHLTMLAAVLVAAAGLVDFFVPAPLTLPSGIAPLAMILSLTIMGVAGTRYRTFSVSARFATDEILRAMGDAVLVCDAGGIIQVANAEAQRLLGVRRDRLVGSHLGRWLRRPGGGEGVVRPGDPLPPSVLGHDPELVLQPETGGEIQVSVSIEPLRSAGECPGVVVVARDIRDSVSSQRALQAAERKYMSLFWHNPGPAYEIDVEGRFLAVNPAAEQLTGRTEEEIRGSAFSELIAPRDQEKAAGLFESVLRGESREYEIAVLTASGEERELRGVSIPILEGGRVVGVFGVALDISEAARAKRELEVQRRYFADLFESSPEGIVLVAAETDQVLRVNAEFTRMFGYTAEEAVGRNLNDLIVPDERRGEGLQMNAAAREGGKVREETVRLRKDRSPVEVSVLARKLLIPGESEQLYGVYRDIGHRKETERRLRQREEELRHAQKLEAVGKLAGGVAHDFNNLLTVINGHAGFALEHVEAGSALEEDLLEIEKAGVRAASLTQQLLAYSRRQVLHPQRLDPNAVVLEIQGMLRRLIGEHIQVETRLTREDVRVRADRGQLEQVLVNLVVNARDAMEDGGTLRFQTDVLELAPDDDRVELWEVAPGPFVRIRVADTGVGMDGETLDRAFEPFFTTKEPGKGTGLGLATVFGIVKQSGGHVTATSTPAGGTVCDVFLPRIEASPAAARTPGVEAPGRAPRGTILVVEDEAPVRKLVVRVLEREGCTVLAAENGARAMELVAAHEGELDLVITDLVMPEMGGRELADHLRRRHPHMPVVFMSGYDEELVGGADPDADLLAKPFTPARLAERVAEALGERSM